MALTPVGVEDLLETGVDTGLRWLLTVVAEIKHVRYRVYIPDLDISEMSPGEERRLLISRKDGSETYNGVVVSNRSQTGL